MQQLMQIIQKEHEHPVDIEFTMNLSENGEYSINLPVTQAASGIQGYSTSSCSRKCTGG